MVLLKHNWCTFLHMDWFAVFPQQCWAIREKMQLINVYLWHFLPYDRFILKSNTSLTHRTYFSLFKIKLIMYFSSSMKMLVTVYVPFITAGVTFSTLDSEYKNGSIYWYWVKSLSSCVVVTSFCHSNTAILDPAASLFGALLKPRQYNSLQFNSATNCSIQKLITKLNQQKLNLSALIKIEWVMLLYQTALCLANSNLSAGR